MFEKMKQFYELFKEGKQVSDPAFWKKGQAYVQPIVAALIMTVVAIAKGFGYELPVSDDLAYSIAGAAFFVVNSALTIVTSRHIGVVPTAPIRETQPSLQSPVEATAEHNAEMADVEDVQHVGQATVQQQTIDDATRAKAEQWVRQHSVVRQPGRFDNGLVNDA
jgi:hypothetical protein